MSLLKYKTCVSVINLIYFISTVALIRELYEIIDQVLSITTESVCNHLFLEIIGVCQKLLNIKNRNSKSKFQKALAYSTDFYLLLLRNLNWSSEF